MHPIVLVAALVLLVPSAQASETKLCGAKPHANDLADDMAMPESNFTFERAVASIAYLRDDVPKMVYGDDPDYREARLKAKRAYEKKRRDERRHNRVITHGILAQRAHEEVWSRKRFSMRNENISGLLILLCLIISA